MSSVNNRSTEAKIHPDVKLISVYNFKGGVGKTTTAHNLSELMAKNDKKVLLLDVDAQCNLTSILNLNVRSIEQMMEEKEVEDNYEISEEIILEPSENLHKLWRRYINGDHMVQTGATYVDEIASLVEVDQTRGYPIFIPGTHNIYDIEQWHNTRKEELRDRFKFVTMILSFSSKLGCEYVIVDLNPGDSLLNRTILFRSDYIVTPTFLDHSSICSTVIFRNKILSDLHTVGMSNTQQYVLLPKQGTVVVSRFKVRDTKVVKLHNKWLDLLKRLCKEYPCSLLCPQIETMALGKMQSGSCLINITSAGSEQWKIQTYTQNLQALLDTIYGLLARREDMEDQQ